MPTVAPARGVPDLSVMMLTTPPVARSPYSTVPAPRMISMRCTLSSGIADQLTLPKSIGLRRWPSSRISVLLPAVSPKPRMSTVESMPRLPERARTSTPALPLSMLGKSRAGVLRMSSRVMTLTLAATLVSASLKRVALTMTGSRSAD